MTTRAIITGGTGFIGSHLVRRLVSSGWDVTVLVRESSNLDNLHDVEDRISIRSVDGTTETLVAHVNETRPDIGIHLAAQFLSDHAPEQVSSLIENTFSFGCQFAESLTLAGCNRLLTTGTSWQHDATAASQPVNLYAALKQGYESVLDYYASARNLQAISLLLFDTYGPRDDRPKLFSFLKKAELATTPIAMSPGEQLIDLVYVDDVINAFEVAAQRLLESRVTIPERYAVSSGSPRPLKAIVASYEQANDVSLNIDWGGRPYRDREVMLPWQTGEPVPQWTPRVSLEEGLQRLRASTENNECNQVRVAG